MNIISGFKKAVISEKSMNEAKKGRYSFRFDIVLNKPDIKKIIEKEFGVHVVGISTSIVKGKRKRTGKRRSEISLTPWKKAVVEVKEGEKIGLFEEGAAK